MPQFTDALQQLGWNPTPENPAQDQNQTDMSTVADLVAKTLAKNCQRPGEDNSQAYFRCADLAHYILAETAPRSDGESAFIPHLAAYHDDNWLRTDFDRIISTSISITHEEATLWATRADRVLELWTSQGL